MSKRTSGFVHVVHMVSLWSTIGVIATLSGNLAAAPVKPIGIGGYDDELVLRSVQQDLKRFERVGSMTPEMIRQMLTQPSSGMLWVPWTPQTVEQLDAEAALRSLQARSLALRTEGMIRANGQLDGNESVVRWRSSYETWFPAEQASRVFDKLTPALTDELLLEQFQSVAGIGKSLDDAIRYAPKAAKWGVTNDRVGLERLQSAIEGATVVATVVEANLALLPPDDETARQARQQLRQVDATAREAQEIYDRQMAGVIAGRLTSLESQVAKLEAAVAARPPAGGDLGPSGDRLHRWVYELPMTYHGDRVAALRQRIDRVFAEAEGVAAEPAMAGAHDARPLGRAAEIVDAYFAALRGASGAAQPDYAAAGELLVQSPSLTQSRAMGYMTRFSRLAQSDLSLLAEHVIGDCAIVMFARADGSHPVPQPAYLIRQDGAWRISPRVTDWTVISDVLDDRQRGEIRELEAWVSRFRSNPSVATQRATPDLGPASAPRQTAAHHPAAGNRIAGTDAPGEPIGEPVAADDAPAEDPMRAAAEAESAAQAAEAEQRRNEDEARHEWLRGELEAYDPYLRAVGEEVFGRASKNFVLDNFYDPANIALLAIDHHLQAAHDPRLKSDNAMERLEASHRVREQERQARALDSAYIGRLMREIDLADAIDPNRIRRYGRSQARHLMYLDVPRGELTRTELTAICDCVGEKMVHVFEQQAATTMKWIDNAFMERVRQCRAEPQSVAARPVQADGPKHATPTPTSTRTPTANVGQQAPAPLPAHEEDSAIEGVDRVIDKADQLGRKLRGLFGGSS